MQSIVVNTVNKYHFEVAGSKKECIGALIYPDKSYFKAAIKTGNSQMVIDITKKTTSVIFYVMLKNIEIGTVNISTNRKCIINFVDNDKKYFFKKTGFWKTRFILANSNNEELFAILPKINWQKRSYDFSIQINEEQPEEMDDFLVLLALHCTIYSLMMMNGGGN
jgi:hypothetical protein